MVGQSSTTFYRCELTCNSVTVPSTSIEVESTSNCPAAATYAAGKISADYGTPASTASNSSCPATLTVNIPTGAIITGVDVNYNVTADNGAYMSEARSWITCTSPGGIAESTIASGSGSSVGTFSYARTGLNIANNVSGDAGYF